jgi:hypothetical protein
MDTYAERTAAANAAAFERMTGADPVLVDVRPAGEVVPGMTPTTILTSGAPLPWAEYTGPQRTAILYAAVYEGLADSAEDADAQLHAGALRVEPTHHHGCVGSVAGIYTASMPVFVVENRTHGNRSFCNFYEGESRRRLNYGVYDDEVRDGLRRLERVIAPVIGDAVRASGGIPLKPIIVRALRMGDELHSRNTASTLLFTRELVPNLFDLERKRPEQVRATLDFLKASDYFFLRLSMAAAKAAADAAHGVEGSSLVTAMTISCKESAIRVSGLGDEWFRGPHYDIACKLFEGYTEDDIVWMGGESHITETVGLGGFAQAAAFALQAYQGGSAEAMVEMNLAMYDITHGENPDFVLPYFGYRGTPTGIDVHRVVDSGVTPVIDGGLGGRHGGQIGAGILRPPLDSFVAAAQEHRSRYGG